MTLNDEAAALANVAGSLLPGEEKGFSVSEDLHGQESVIIQGAQNILAVEGTNGVEFSYDTGTIRIERIG